MVHFPPGETLGAVSVVGEDAAADSTGERTRIAGTAPDIGNEPPPASAPPVVAERKAEAASGYIRTLDGWRAVAVTRSELASCLLFFRNFLPTQLGGYYTPHFWSLAVEEHFYLIWPALLVVVPRRRLLATLGWLWAALAMLLRFPFNLKLAHPMIALLLTGTVIQPSWMVSRVLDARPTRWIGRISYSLYLWQQVFLVGVRTPLPAPLETAQHLPLSLLATFVFAALSYYSVEKPMVALGRRLASR